MTTAAYPWTLQEIVVDPPGQNGTQTGAYNLAIVSFNNVETRQTTAVNT